eukprot:848878-Pleurochrysis_carterae.AAC.1
MHARGALALRSPSSSLETSARNGRRRPVSTLLEPPRRRASAPAPAPAPSPRRFVFYILSSAPAALDGSTGSDPIENQNV